MTRSLIVHPNFLLATLNFVTEMSFRKQFSTSHVLEYLSNEGFCYMGFGEGSKRLRRANTMNLNDPKY
jgi:hypothetical protein